MKALPLLALVAALAASGCSKVEDKAFGERVRAYLLEHPEVLEEVVAKLDEKKQAARLEAHKAGLAAIGPNRAALERDNRDLVANPQGTVTVVQFADYRCGYCKTAAPEILALIEKDPDIRVVFKEFPIFHGVSDTAARIALTPQVKAQGLAFYRDWMAEKALDDAAIDRRLKEAGLDPVAIRREAQSPEIAAHIAATTKLATALQIQGTPAYVIGDVLVPGADIEAIKAAILQARVAKAKVVS